MRLRTLPHRGLRGGTLLLALLFLWGSPPSAAQEAVSGGGSAPLADARLAFARGVAAFDDGDFETAREHFEEAVRLAPGDDTAREWLALAEANLRRLEEGAAPATAPASAPEWSGDFAVLPEVPRFDGRVFVGAGYDSNPNLLPDDLVLATPEGDPVSGEDSDIVILADVRAGFQRADETAGRTFGVVLHGSQSLYDDFDYLDFRRVGGVVQLALGKDPLGYLAGPLGYSRVPRGLTRTAFLLQVGASKDWLDGEDFADRLEAAASFAFNEGGWGQTRLSAGYGDEDFDRDPEGGPAELLARSGEELGGELAQYLFFGRRNRYLRLGVGAWERDAGAAHDRSSLVLDGQLSLPLGGRSTLHLFASRRTDDYDEPVSNLFDPAGEPREDDELRAGGALVVRLVGGLFVSGRASWTDREIDMPAGFATPDLSYERTVATLGLSWVF